jgi:hypothetical protein
MTVRGALVLSACAALAACATPRELVWIGVSGDQACVVAADDERFTLPVEASRFESRLRRMARRSEGAVIGEVHPATSFTCWTRAIAALRGIGFRRLGLATAPPRD